MNTCDDYNSVKTKAYVKSLKDLLPNVCLRSLRLIWRQGFEFESFLRMLNKEDFKDFKAMTEKNRLFHPVNLSLSLVNNKLF